MVTQEQGRIEGRFLRRSEGQLFLRRDIDEIGVSLLAMDALWVRGRATWTGGKAGIISGGILGGLSGGDMNFHVEFNK